jgi:hypothetical protein
MSMDTSEKNTDAHPNDGTCLKGNNVLLFELNQESSQLYGLIAHPQHILKTLRLSTQPQSKTLIKYLCTRFHCADDELESKSTRISPEYVKDYVTNVIGNRLRQVRASNEKSDEVAPIVVCDEWTSCVLDAARLDDFRELSENPGLLHLRLTFTSAPHMLKFGDAMAARLGCTTFEQIGNKTKEEVMTACEHYIEQSILNRQPNTSNVSPTHYNTDNASRDPTSCVLPDDPVLPVPGE